MPQINVLLIGTSVTKIRFLNEVVKEWTEDKPFLINYQANGVKLKKRNFLQNNTLFQLWTCNGLEKLPVSFQKFELRDLDAMIYLSVNAEVEAHYEALRNKQTCFAFNYHFDALEPVACLKSLQKRWDETWERRALILNARLDNNSWFSIQNFPKEVTSIIILLFLAVENPGKEIWDASAYIEPEVEETSNSLCIMQ